MELDPLFAIFSNINFNINCKQTKKQTKIIPISNESIPIDPSNNTTTEASFSPFLQAQGFSSIF